MRYRLWQELLSLQAAFLGAWCEADAAVFTNRNVPLSAVPLRAAPLGACCSHNGRPLLAWRGVTASSLLEREVLREQSHRGVGGRGRWGWRGCVWRGVFAIIGRRPVTAGPGAKLDAPPGVFEVLQVTRIPVQTLYESLLLVHRAVRGQGVGAGRTRLQLLHAGGGRGTPSSWSTSTALLADEEGQAGRSAGSGWSWRLCAGTVQYCRMTEYRRKQALIF